GTRRSSSTRRRRTTRRVLLWLALVVIALVMAAPFLWMFLTAVRSQQELYSADVTFWPQQWHWENFATALDTASVSSYARNSFTVVVMRCLSNWVLGTMCVYALAKLGFRGSTSVCPFLLASMLIPFYAIVSPEFLVVRFVPLAGGNGLFGQG